MPYRNAASFQLRPDRELASRGRVRRAHISGRDGAGEHAAYLFGILRGSYLDDRFPVAVRPQRVESVRACVRDPCCLRLQHDRAAAFDMHVPGVFSEVRVPQRRGTYMRIIVVPPMESDVAWCDGGRRTAVAGRSHRPPRETPATRGTCADSTAPRRSAVEPVDGVRSRSVTLLFVRPAPSVRAVEVTSPTARRCVLLRHVTITDTTLSVALGDRRLERVDVTMARALAHSLRSPSTRCGCIRRALNQTPADASRPAAVRCS